MKDAGHVVPCRRSMARFVYSGFPGGGGLIWGSMKGKQAGADPSGWLAAVRLLERQGAGGARLDRLLEEDAMSPAVEERARTRRLVFGALRHKMRIDGVLARFLARPARPCVHAVLQCAAAEMLAGMSGCPPGPVIHHAVNIARRLASPAEAGMVNAVLRRAVPLLNEGEPEEGGEGAWPVYYSHPEWLVRRWIEQFGMADTRSLLRWNQTVAPVHARACGGGEGGPPPGFTPTAWPGFWRVDEAPWPEVERLLSEGKIYLQDPATRLAPAALAVQPGERVLDLCAAPGGKTLQLAEALGGSGFLVAVDRPGARMGKLRDNLANHHLEGVVRILGADLNSLTRQALTKARLPDAYDAVLLDVPCSNTGVLRHRVDVKWRLNPGDFIKLTKLQKSFLERAAALVAPGGRLAYSTCSIERIENQDMVEAFLAGPSGSGFSLGPGMMSLPWQTGHDGAGVFVLRRGATAD